MTILGAALDMLRAAAPADRVRLALGVIDQLPKSDQGELIEELWTHDHDLVLTQLGPRRALWLMASAGRPYTTSAKTVRVYRGAKSPGGLSWSLDEDCAHYFAERNGSAWVWSAVVRVRSIVFYTDARREREVLVVPAGAVGKIPADRQAADRWLAQRHSSVLAA